MGRRAGRKRRQDAKRLPSGKIIYPYEDHQATVKMQRLRKALWGGLSNEMLGYPLGVLALQSYITDEEFTAGKAFTALWVRYSTLVGLPIPTPRAIDFNAMHGKSLLAEPEDKEVQAVKDRMIAIETRVIEICGRIGFVQLRMVCIEESEPFDRPLLKRALAALVEPGKRRSV